jgi:acyl dehydratase
MDGLKNRAAQRFAAVASLSWQWNFRRPLYPGDRIHGRVSVTDRRLTKRGDRGILTLSLELRNGKDQILQDGTNLLMVRSRAAGDSQ